MTALAAKLDEMRTRFGARAQNDLAAIELALLAGDIARLADITHRLAGLAAMLGHPAVGDAALAVEDAVLANRVCDAQIARLKTLLSDLANV